MPHTLCVPLRVACDANSACFVRCVCAGMAYLQACRRGCCGAESSVEAGSLLAHLCLAARGRAPVQERLLPAQPAMCNVQTDMSRLCTGCTCTFPRRPAMRRLLKKVETGGGAHSVTCVCMCNAMADHNPIIGPSQPTNARGVRPPLHAQRSSSGTSFSKGGASATAAASASMCTSPWMAPYSS